jgi:hypothetical protein
LQRTGIFANIRITGDKKKKKKNGPDTKREESGNGKEIIK